MCSRLIQSDEVTCYFAAVPPTAYTTFYFAVLANMDIVQANVRYSLV